MDCFATLEFDKILEMLAERAVSGAAKSRCLSLAPAKDLKEAQRASGETTQAKLIIEEMGTPPLPSMSDLQKAVGLLNMESMLTPGYIGCVYTFLMSVRRMKAYLGRAECTGAEMAFFGGAFLELPELSDEIDRCIRNGQVEDRASQRLYELRRGIESKEEQIKAKLASMLRKNKEYFSEGFPVVRGGRHTLPVKKEHRGRVDGFLVDVSNTGGTCFIEPAQARRLQGELNDLLVEEDSETRRILYALTADIYEALPSIKANMEAMGELDFLFAKAKLSMDMKAGPIRMVGQREIRVLSARHPLIPPETAVPLDFGLGGGTAGIVITGPNTGGKTVALKTIGLLSLMAQSGLHVPAGGQSAICMFDAVYCDIGDGQSISENLSTFSSHITNIIDILRHAGSQSLALFDELGSGTDPAEGMGIAAAVLEELLGIGCLFAATTHYPEIKGFAERSNGLANARMAFDRETLTPLYRLEIGEAGESCALYIAERLGMPERLLKRAREMSCAKGLDSDAGGTGSGAGGGRGILPVAPLKVGEEQAEPEAMPRSMRFNIGDSVTAYPQREIGLVYAAADEKGRVGVQIKGRKLLISHKRLKLKVAASELYPEGYDFSIVFDTVDNRKAMHVMERKHVEGNMATIESL